MKSAAELKAIFDKIPREYNCLDLLSYVRQLHNIKFDEDTVEAILQGLVNDSSATAQPIQSMRLYVDFSKKEEEALFTQLVSRIKINKANGFIIYLSTIGINSSTDLNFEKIRSIIQTVSENPCITQLSFVNCENLWKLSEDSLSELCETFGNHSTLKTIILLNLHDTGLVAASKQWNETEKFDFLKKYLAVQTLSGGTNYPLTEFPYPLSIKQYSILFKEFAENNPSQSHKISSWVDSCPLLANEERSALRLAACSMDENAYSFLGNSSNISITDMLKSEDFFQAALKELKDKPLMYANTVLKLDLAIYKKNDFANVILFINTCRSYATIPGMGFSLSFTNIQNKDNLLDAMSIFQATQNPAISTVEFNDNDLSIFSLEQLSHFFRALLKDKAKIKLNLKKTKIKTPQFKDFLILLTLFGDLKVEQLDLTENAFWELPHADLLQIFVVAKQHHVNLRIWCYDELTFWKKTTENWTDKEKIAFARQQTDCMQAYSWEYHSPFPFTLTSQQYFDFFQYWLQTKNHRIEDNFFWSLIRCPLEYEHRLHIIRLMYKKEPNTSQHGPFENLQLEPEHRLELYLLDRPHHDAEESRFRLELYNLFATPLSASQLLAPWEKIGQSRDADSEERAQQLRELAYPKLFNACQTLWPSAAFKEIEAQLRPFLSTGMRCIPFILEYYGYDTTITLNKLMTFIPSDDYRAQKLINMFEWFTYATVLLSTKMGLSLEQVDAVLGEILDFADPKMRYQLTGVFLNKIAQSTKGLRAYISLTSHEAQWKKVPAIPLAYIVAAEDDLKQEKENDEQHTLNKVAFLRTLPLAYKEGRMLKTLVGSIHAFSVCTELNSTEKLQFLDATLTLRNPRHAETEQLFNAFLVAAQIKEAADRIKKMNETYHKLVAMYTAPVLTAFGLTKAIQTAKKEPLDNQALLRLKNKLLLSNDAKRFIAHHNSPAELHERLKEQSSQLLLVEGLSELGQSSRLKGLDKDRLHETNSKILRDIFQLGEERFSFYRRTFLGCRNESGLLTYLGKMRSLNDKEGARSQALYRRFIETVLTPEHQEFLQVRYNPLSSIHLSKVLLERKHLSELWRAGHQEDLLSYITSRKILDKATTFNFEKYLLSKIYHHKHLPPKEYPVLKSYLDTKDVKERAKIKRELETSLRHHTEKPTNKKRTIDNARTKIQHTLMEFIETKSDDKKTQIRLLNEVTVNLRLLPVKHEFRNDVKALINGLSSKAKELKSYTGCIIINTDYHWDLFMSGTDVPGSCQRVNGNPYLNKCLMAYVMDGKIRMIAIKATDGTLIARCILRLLWDTSLQMPVLFQEETYPSFMPQVLQTAMNIFAIERANQLNLPLLSSESTEDSYQYPNEIESLGSIAQWEYVDALHTEAEDGKFVIKNCLTICTPEDQIKATVSASILKNQRHITELNPSILQTILGYYKETNVKLMTMEHEQSLSFAWSALQKKNQSKEKTSTMTVVHPSPHCS